jgi:hypothetical protein
MVLLFKYVSLSCRHGCGVGVGRNFRWSRKEFLGGVGVGKNVPTPTPTSV